MGCHIMIDFRYHLVSIIAIFLALAVGIVLGTTALNGPIQDNLNGNLSRVSDEKRGLESEVSSLRSQVKSADDFAVGVSPDLVKGALADQKVLLVSSPDVPASLAENLTPLLVQAGATVTGQLRLLPALSEPDSRQLVEDLVARVVPSGVDLSKGEPVERATSELAAALGKAPTGDGVRSDQAQAVVAAFEEANLVQYVTEGSTLEQATVAIVLSGPADKDRAEPAALQQQAMLAMASALDDRSSGVVVAGPQDSAARDGLLKDLRGDSGVAGAVSSVDNANRGVGQVAVVRALAEQLQGGTGQYGDGPGATGPLPLPTS